MADAAIKEKPKRAAYALAAPTRGTGSSRYKFTAKWDFNNRLNDKSNPARCEGWHVHWTFSLYNVKSKKWKELKYERKSPKPERKDWVLDLNSFKLKDGDSKTYSRADFYPYTDWCLRYIRVSVCPYNSKGNGSWTSATRKIEQPRKPTIPTLSMREEDGNILLTLKANNGTDYKEAARTDYWIGIRDSRTGKNVTEYNGSFSAGTSSGETSHSYNSMDAYGRMGVAVGDHLKVTCYAWTKGLFGNSEMAEKVLYISIPWMPEIGNVSFSSYDESGRVRFWVKTNSTEVHPITGIKLQAIKDKPYTMASQIPGSDWDQCEDLAVDDAQCSALSTMVANLRSADGLYTWVRLKSWNMSEIMFPRYSYVRRMDELFTPEPSAKSDKVAIVSVEPGDDGESAKLVLAFDADGDTGTEVSWSDDINAWQSTEPPKTYNVTWQETKSNTVGTKTYTRQSVVYIPGLNEGKTYYFRARRYYEGENATTYGPYNAAAADTTCAPAMVPSSVTLVAQPFVQRGGDLLLSWVHEGESEQSRWEVITGETCTETDDDGKEHLYIRGDTDSRYKVVSVAGGEDARGGCVVKWDVLLEKLNGANSIPLAVRVSTGGEFVASEAYNVLVVDQPTLSVGANDLTARPLSVALACSSNARVSIVCKSQGVGGDSPTGMSYQEDGDAVWSDELDPQWELDEEGVYTCVLSVPETVDFWDGGHYTITARATDTDTGMRSDEAACEFSVDYARKSPGPPEDAVMVEPYDETDSDTGWRTRGCRVTAPEGETLIEGDLYDVYRLTLDGPDLVAEGVTPGTTIDDQFAPFNDDGGLAYRVALRTVDGCVEWDDYTYELPGFDLRLDWDGGYVELPYNVVMSGQWTKPFGRTRYFGGSLEGDWDEGGVEHDGGLSTDVIKVVDRERIAAVFEMANYCGPVLVRTPDGRCFDANVDVRSYQWGYNDNAIPISLDAKRIDLTGEHMASLPEPDESDPDEGDDES